jgi:single-strand DNA-binding protein
MPSGGSVVNFSVATTRYYKDKNGVKQEDTQYHNVVSFGPQAQTIAQYMKKGSSIMVEGRLQTRSWDSPEGKKYRTEIIVDSFQFGPKREGGVGAPAGAGAMSAPAAPASSPAEAIEYPEENINPEDIPF